MSRLFEHEGLSLFKGAGIQVPRFEVVTDVKGAVKACERIGFPAVLKAQVLVGSRRKAGGVIQVSDPEEARRAAQRVFSGKVGGETASKILVSEWIEASQELYVSVTIDRSAAMPVLLASGFGGVEVEEAALKKPGALAKEAIDPWKGLSLEQCSKVFDALHMPEAARSAFASVCLSLYTLMCDLDADLVEVNPLALTPDRRLVALDSKVILNDDALFRHPEFISTKERHLAFSSELERLAWQKGVRLVDSGGDIGIIGNGAGLTMATMDLVRISGGRPADFLDVGGGASADQFERSLSVLLDCPRVKVVLVNVFGGITRCDEIAEGIKRALRERTTKKSVLVRLVGTNEERGRDVLNSIEGASIECFTSADDAAKRAVDLTVT
jgi:succinyl-CoA synthetase beta subunit